MSITREQFLDYFRSDDYSNQMSADDCIEVFRGALKGSSDLTQELLEEVCSDYDTSLTEVLGNVSLETRVYLVSTDTENASALLDEQPYHDELSALIASAEESGLVYSLSGFQEAHNHGKLCLSNMYLCITQTIEPPLNA